MTPFKCYELKIKARSLALEGELIHQNESKLKAQIERCKAKIAELELEIAQPSKSHDHPALQQKLAACRVTLVRLRADRDSLSDHRKGIVRAFARSAHLAYGFLKGRSYKEIEPKRFSDPRWDAISTMIEKYGARAGTSQERMQRFEQWKQEAGKPEVRS